jgi:hypothetical protein
VIVEIEKTLNNKLINSTNPMRTKLSHPSPHPPQSLPGKASRHPNRSKQAGFPVIKTDYFSLQGQSEEIRKTMTGSTPNRPVGKA